MTQHLNFSLYSHYEYDEEKHRQLLEAEKAIAKINSYRNGPELYFGHLEKIYSKYPEFIGFSLFSSKDLSSFHNGYKFSINKLNLTFEDNLQNITKDFQPVLNFLNDYPALSKDEIFKKYHLDDFSNMNNRSQRFDIYQQYIQNNIKSKHQKYWNNTIQELQNNKPFNEDIIVTFNNLTVSIIQSLFTDYDNFYNNFVAILNNIEILKKEQHFLFMQHVFETNSDISHIFYVDSLNDKDFDFYTYNEQNKMLTNYHKKFSVIYEIGDLQNIKSELSFDVEHNQNILIFEKGKMFLEYSKNISHSHYKEDVKTFLTCFYNYHEKKILDSLINKSNTLKIKRL